MNNLFSEKNKRSWEIVSFGEIVREVKESCTNPEEEGIERVVGLEHIQPLDIHISKWKSTADKTSFTRVFKKGHVLFGKRRAYQRKAALAEFNGLCSGDIIVMEAIKDRLDPSLLPFIVHSDKFYEWAVSTSAGSLSPRTKFKHLAEFKLQIPPLPEQKQIADLLTKTDFLIQNLKKSYGRYLTFRLSLMSDRFRKRNETSKILKDLPVYTVNGLWKTKEAESIQVKVIRSTEFSNFGELDFSKLDEIPVSKKQYKSRKLCPSDIILEKSGGSPDQPVGRVVYFTEVEGEYSFSNFTSLLRVEDEDVIEPKYLFYFLLNIYEMGLTNRMQNQTTGIRNLNYDLYSSLEVPLPSINKQKKVIEEIDDIEINRHILEKQIEQTQVLLSAIINKFS